MTTLTVEINKEKDLPALQELLSRMGLKYQLDEYDNDDWANLSESAIAGIKEGIADADAGRVQSNEYVTVIMSDKLNMLKSKNG